MFPDLCSNVRPRRSMGRLLVVLRTMQTHHRQYYSGGPAVFLRCGKVMAARSELFQMHETHYQ